MRQLDTSAASPQPDLVGDPRAVWQRLAWGVLVLALAVGVFSGMRRALRDRPDWQPLRSEVCYVWEHGHTAPGTAMFGYLPTTTFALWPFMTWTPLPIGAALYVLSNVLAGLASIWIVARWWLREDADATFVWPVALISANFAHAIQANQLTMWTLLLCVAGLALAERRRGLIGGALLGLAALLKTMPAIFLFYLLLRRRGWAVVGMAAAFVVFDAAPSVAYFGWRGAADEHMAWLRRAQWHSNGHQIDDPLLRVHRHRSNASYSGVLTRWLREIRPVEQQVILFGDPPAEVVEQTRAELTKGQALSLDPMPPREGTWQKYVADISWVPRFHVADFSATTVRWIWGGTLAIGLVVLVWLTWRTQRGGAEWTALAALWMLAMFWPSPMARHYYLSWAFPALAVVWCVLQREGRRPGFRWSGGPVLAACSLAAWGHRGGMSRLVRGTLVWGSSGSGGGVDAGGGVVVVRHPPPTDVNR